LSRRLALRVCVGVLVVGGAFGGDESAGAAGSKASTSSRDEYVEALIPVVTAEAADGDIVLSSDEASCAAAQYVQGFTLRRLRAVGSPAIVARERARTHFDFDRFGVTKAQEARIVGTAMWRCLGIARMLAIGFHARGADLSDASRECLEARFDEDPQAEQAYIEATIRDLSGRPRVMTKGLVRTAGILGDCLTIEEQEVLAPAR
jgi:hypothetical protein